MGALINGIWKRVSSFFPSYLARNRVSSLGFFSLLPSKDEPALQG